LLIFIGGDSGTRSVAELLAAVERAVPGIDGREEGFVSSILIRLGGKAQQLADASDGQDMVEYALVMGLLSCGITASSNFLATSLAAALTAISTTIGGYVH
jgi:Flp pilus assembly pilin Flp